MTVEYDEYGQLIAPKECWGKEIYRKDITLSFEPFTGADRFVVDRYIGRMVYLGPKDGYKR